MSFKSQEESRERKLSVSEDGTLSAFSRLAISSLRNGDLPRLAGGIDALLSSKDGDSITSSDGTSSRDPDSPTQPGRPFDPHHRHKTDPRDAVRDPREHRRKGSFVSRLMHR